MSSPEDRIKSSSSSWALLRAVGTTTEKIGILGIPKKGISVNY
jgi:hypothetical protein